MDPPTAARPHVQSDSIPINFCKIWEQHHAKSINCPSNIQSIPIQSYHTHTFITYNSMYTFHQFANIHHQKKILQNLRFLDQVRSLQGWEPVSPIGMLSNSIWDFCDLIFCNLFKRQTTHQGNQHSFWRHHWWVLTLRFRWSYISKMSQRLIFGCQWLRESMTHWTIACLVPLLQAATGGGLVEFLPKLMLHLQKMRSSYKVRSGMDIQTFAWKLEWNLHSWQATNGDLFLELTSIKQHVLAEVHVPKWSPPWNLRELLKA